MREDGRLRRSSAPGRKFGSGGTISSVSSVRASNSPYFRPFATCCSSGQMGRFSVQCRVPIENHGRDHPHRSVVVLRRVLEDLLGRAGAARREDHAVLRDRQEAILSDAVREVLGEVSGEGSGRLVSVEPRGYPHAHALRLISQGKGELLPHAPGTVEPIVIGILLASPATTGAGLGGFRGLRRARCPGEPREMRPGGSPPWRRALPRSPSESRPG